MAPLSFTQLQKTFHEEYLGLRLQNLYEEKILAALRDCEEDPDYRDALGVEASSGGDSAAPPPRKDSSETQGNPSRPWVCDVRWNGEAFQNSSSSGTSKPQTSKKVGNKQRGSRVLPHTEPAVEEDLGNKAEDAAAESKSVFFSAKKRTEKNYLTSSSLTNMRGCGKTFRTTLKTQKLPARTRNQVVRYMASIARRNKPEDFVKSNRCCNGELVWLMLSCEETKPDLFRSVLSACEGVRLVKLANYLRPEEGKKKNRAGRQHGFLRQNVLHSLFGKNLNPTWFFVPGVFNASVSHEDLVSLPTVDKQECSRFLSSMYMTAKRTMKSIADFRNEVGLGVEETSRQVDG